MCSSSSSTKSTADSTSFCIEEKTKKNPFGSTKPLASCETRGRAGKSALNQFYWICRRPKSVCYYCYPRRGLCPWKVFNPSWHGQKCWEGVPRALLAVQSMRNKNKYIFLLDCVSAGASSSHNNPAGFHRER